MLVENGSFSWGDVETVLKNINIKIEKGQLAAVVGTVGSGKSSLLSALLGEMEKISGRVNTVGKIAYVSQVSLLLIVHCIIIFGSVVSVRIDNEIFKL